MYFVTVKRPEFVLFCMSGSERFALALDEHKVVHFFVRAGKEWQLAHKWKSEDFSHTTFMVALRDREEPADPQELLQLLPAALR